MTNSEYHAHPAISKSKLFKIKDSPEKFKFELDNPPQQTAAMLFGSAFHKYVLEPDSFYEDFTVAPSVNRRTKAGKEQWEAYLSESDGKSVITLDDFETISGMAESIKKNRYAPTLLSGPHEQSFFWSDDLTGEECKCRPDALAELGRVNIISDLKSCESAKTEDFMRDAIKYGYDLQAYMYTSGLQANTGKEYQFVFIAVEKKPPYAVNVLQADGMFIKHGEDLFREYIGIYHDCKQTGNWWGYNRFSGAISSITLPAYLRREYGE